MATWSGGTRKAPAWWPAEASPGSAIECPSEWSADAEPTRTGYTFLGWSTDPAAPKGQLLNALEVPADAPLVEGEGGAKHLTLYAIWTPIEYSVMFDLTKNPVDPSTAYSFVWTGKGTFSDLGDGRYRLSGITLEDYDPETGLIAISTPARGTGGYRFLGWVEPDRQQDPAIAVMESGSSGWYINPVALPYYEYVPVLTARWGLSFDIDVPSQITFDEYDALEIEGSLTDTTEKDAIDEESANLHDAGQLAHFCSQSTATDYKIVGLKSTRAATADDVLTTVNSALASHEDVLGGEKLLSLFSENDVSEDAAVHFKLDDAIDMDSERYAAFVIPKQAPWGHDPAVDRDSEERLYVSYRLNLDNKVDGATEPNHGLVVASAPDYERTRIANVSYEFAVADHDIEKTIPGDPLYIDDNGTVYGLDYIKRAADDLSVNGVASKYYAQFKGYLDAQKTNNGNWGVGPYFKVWINGAYWDLQLIGICQDTKTSGGKAGLTFQTRDVFSSVSNIGYPGSGEYLSSMNTSNTTSGGWASSNQRKLLRGTFWNYLDADLRSVIAPVTKFQQLSNGTSSTDLQKTTDETVWLPSMYEVFGNVFSSYNTSENLTTVAGYVPFQYMGYQGNGGDVTNVAAIKLYWVNNTATAANWFLRSAWRSGTSYFCVTRYLGTRYNGQASGLGGIAPCFCL